MVLSVDPEAKRMSLSMKELSAPPEPEKKEDEPAEAAPSKKKSKSRPARCWAESAARPATALG